MKILVIAIEYSDFLRWLHAQTRGLGKLLHEEQGADAGGGSESIGGGSLLFEKSAT
jgi:hypothetical protein